MIYTKHAHPGQSSPVYSVGFDMSHLYVALDQCLSLVSFDGKEQNNQIAVSNKTNSNNNSNNGNSKQYR